MIGICDHNSAENVAATIKAAEHTSLTVIPGMEISSQEEVHVLALFEHADEVGAMQDIVYNHLPRMQNKPDLFGEQIVANEHDEVVRFEKRLLMTATDIPLNDLVSTIHDNNGIAIAAHVDRPSFGLYGQLGFIPPDLLLDGVELSRHITLEQAKQRFPDIERYRVITSSDAHCLEDIGTNATRLRLFKPDYTALKKALQDTTERIDT
jgi:PHP family Zn ribbon phosphoesterase